MLNHINNSFRKGDTLIEVMLAVGVFGLVVVGAISLMNRGLATAQNTLEVTMARQEIDTQAEVLRFLQNAYISTKDALSDDYCGNPKSYRDIWKCITSDTHVYAYDKIAVADPNFYTRTTEAGMSCDDLFRVGNQTAFSIPDKSFILNPRTLGITDIDTSDPATAQAAQDAVTNRLKQIIGSTSIVTTTGTYPRLLYNATGNENMSDAEIDSTGKLITKDSQKTLNNAEGIWVTAIASESGVECVDESSPTGKSIRPDYYDFHIQTCWDSVAGNMPSTINSTVRLFNPDQVSLTSKKNTLTFDNANWEEYGTRTDHTGESYIGGTCSTQPQNYNYDHVVAESNTDGSVNVTFSGYTNYAMDEGIKHTIEGINHFTIDMDIDSSNIIPHPGGTLTIALGPVKAEIGVNGAVTISATGGASESATLSGFHLLLEKNGTSYKVCITTANKCVSTSGDSASATIDYNFQHGSHACPCISKVFLTNIMMVNHDAGASIEAGDCVRYTVVPPPPDPPAPTETFTLTLNANGGSFAASAIRSASCTASGSVVPSCQVGVPNTTPTNGTKQFLGWASSPSATTSEYGSGQRIQLSQDKTIYAVWKTELEASSVFIVTTWNSRNSDIDSHLLRGNMHISFRNKSYGEDVTLQDGNIVKQFFLDVDALSSTNYDSSTDRNCGSNCGDGYIEVIAMRKLRPATYQFYTHDWNGHAGGEGRLSNSNLTVRIYKGEASAGIGQFPRNVAPIATLKYDDIMRSHSQYNGKDISWFVCTIEITENAEVKVVSKKQITSGEPQ
ncbi:InlB B-repeat-containing protein [Candidatus Saccharibacteria bacterium]|nr:InlB B-repeat-containing protein [Candidatus Saccharibacteria bacterium]